MRGQGGWLWGYLDRPSGKKAQRHEGDHSGKRGPGRGRSSCKSFGKSLGNTELVLFKSRIQSNEVEQSFGPSGGDGELWQQLIEGVRVPEFSSRHQAGCNT